MLQARSKYIEDKTNGSAVIDMLKDEVSGIFPVNPYGKKTRKNALSPLFETGNVSFYHINPYTNGQRML
ncbi:phage terminase large subunit family protein [Ureibacillus thermosphaericus]|uniref:phage terminase large subunit family protein n=1 Tax=Ureibacillus thermosphaericus TaxID=51173 RepID=UPI0039089374